MGDNHSYEYLSIKEGSFLVCFDCHIEISQAPVPRAFVLVHHWKAPMSRGALSWFHDFLTYSGEVIEYRTIFSLKIIKIKTKNYLGILLMLLESL
jgi:hypothetical protein